MIKKKTLELFGGSSKVHQDPPLTYRCQGKQHSEYQDRLSKGGDLEFSPSMLIHSPVFTAEVFSHGFRSGLTSGFLLYAFGVFRIPGWLPSYR